MRRSRSWAHGLGVAVDAVWWLSVAVVVVVAALLALVAVHAARGGVLTLDFYFRLPTSAYHLSSARLALSAAQVGVSSGPLGFAHPRLAFVLVAGAVLAVLAGWWLFVLYQLRRLLAALGQGETFARQNAIRLRRIGTAVVVFGLAHALVIWVGGLYLKSTLTARGVSVRSHFGLDVPLILLGLLLLALAAAFAVGSELAEEQALTV